MTDIEFLDELPELKPPNPDGKNGGHSAQDPVFVAFAEALRDNPKQWAHWPKSSSLRYLYNVVYGIKSGKSPAPASLRKGFEAHVRQGVLYVRYVGEAAS